MSIKKIIFQSTNFFLVLFIFFTILPVKLNYSSIVIIILFFFGVLNLFTSKNEFYLKSKAKIFFVSAPVVIYALGLVNTSNLDYGIRFLEMNMSYIAFPFIIYSLGKFINQEKIFKTFLMALVIINAFLWYLFFYYFNFGTKFYMIVTTDIYHSTYLGMYNLFAYWLCVLLLVKKNKKLYSFLAIFFLLSAIITSARIIFILSILSIIITVFFTVKSNINRLGLLFLSIIIGASIVLSIPAIKQKFNQLIEIEQIGFDKSNYQSISSRFGKIEGSIKVLKNNLLFGTGTGDMIDELVKEYETMDFVMGYKYRYNPHNQYLDNLTRNGIIGGGICLFTIFLLPFIIALRKRNPILLAFMFVVSGACLTESILNVHKGITFYAFFATFLIYNTLYSNNDLLSNNND